MSSFRSVYSLKILSTLVMLVSHSEYYVIRLFHLRQGRRYFKKVTVAGTTTLHHRYIYRGYLQIACVDCTRSGHPALWLVTWAPSQPTATRPLAIQKDGTWFTYGYDITKNICEVFGQHGYIRTAYSYAPFGAVTESGDVTQPFQWSSEHYDSELDLVYYNYRHYSPTLGRFLSRDPIEEIDGMNLFSFLKNIPTLSSDLLGLIFFKRKVPCTSDEIQKGREGCKKGEKILVLEKTYCESICFCFWELRMIIPWCKDPCRRIRNRISEHQEKLSAYIENPDKYDHRGILKNASPEIRASIIARRVAHLNREIKAFSMELLNCRKEHGFT
ncbi:MAG: RHS repeat-associated core domain-containing protein [Clostridia bacterium]|nr:RHS repeat-associated core domain-containing protein [Clostridia bacterium]